MKINWGLGIAVFYACFMAAMIFMVVRSTGFNTHLVQDNYYEKDLNYENFRQKRANAAVLKDKLDVDYKPGEQQIHLTFPDTMPNLTGKIALFRPSNKHLDRKYDIVLEDNLRMSIPVDRTTQSGLWRIQVEWAYEGKQYFLEESIVL